MKRRRRRRRRSSSSSSSSRGGGGGSSSSSSSKSRSRNRTTEQGYKELHGAQATPCGRGGFSFGGFGGWYYLGATLLLGQSLMEVILEQKCV